MMRIVFLRGKPLHPLLRILLTVLGIIALALLFIFGAVIIVILIAIAVVTVLVKRWQLRHRVPPPPPPEDSNVIEGTFEVVDESKPHDRDKH
jgi:hypothetical protein